MVHVHVVRAADMANMVLLSRTDESISMNLTKHTDMPPPSVPAVPAQ